MCLRARPGELVTLAVASFVNPGQSAIRRVCPARRLTLAPRFPGLIWLLAQLRLLLLLRLVAGLALLLLLGSLLKLKLLLLSCLLLTSLVLLSALLGLLFLGLLALGLQLSCLLLRCLPGLILLLALQLLLLIACLPLLLLLGALLGLLLFLQLPLRLLLPPCLFLHGALAERLVGLPTLLLLLTCSVNLLALLVALKPLLLALRLLDGVASGIRPTGLHRQRHRIGVAVPISVSQRLFAQCALPQ